MTNNYIKIILIPFLILAIACKKDLNYKEKSLAGKANNNAEFYTLGIIKANGKVKLFSEFKNNPDLFTYSDLLIYKDEVEPIKTYSGLNISDLNEIQILKKKYAHNSFLKKNSRENTDTLFNIDTSARLWPNNKVKFTIDPAFRPEFVQRIRDAISEWTSKTNIEFTQYAFIDGNQEGLTHILRVGDSLFAKSALGAPSTVRAGYVYLGDELGTHAIVHELGHTLGFIHEHQRPCRDRYLRINIDAINYLSPILSADSNGIKMLETEWTDMDDVYNDEFPFDYKSIMIYSSYGNHMLPMGSNIPGNPLRTLLIEKNLPLYTRKDNGGIIDVSFELSELDIERTNRVYPRADTCPIR